MENDKLYLNGNYQFKTFLTQYSSSIYIRSVKRTYGYKLSRFINKYRVEEFIERLKNDQNNHFTLGIATDVGFNSKSSFNAIFKKYKA
jgi:AraC-like DNA-binding protein